MNADADTLSPPRPQDALRQALAAGQFGLALLDDAQIVEFREGAMSDWLPAEGAPAGDSPLLLNMEESIAALKTKGGEIVLPSMRLPSEQNSRVTISIVWDAAMERFVVVTAPDHGGDQIDRLLASERREKQMLQQQADAAAAQLRVADTLYRDIVESTGDLVLRFSPQFDVVFANREAARFLGKPQNALIGAALHELFPTTESAPWRAARAAERPAAFEMLAHDSKGAAVWLAWDIRYLGAEAGGESQATVRDVTSERRLRVERERAQEEARAAAIANERLRIAHDLHDTLVRSIVTLIAQMRLVAKKTVDDDAKASLAEMDADARKGLTEAREAIMQMRAGPQERVDLAAIVAAFGAGAGAPQVTTEFAIASAELPVETEQLFAAVLREALRNIELHAGARHVRVALARDAKAARLDIEDDGVGFSPSAPPPGHFGVTGMRERARLAGATLGLNSAPGSGVRVTLVAPLG